MNIIIIISLCILFWVLRKLENAKWKKLNDTANTRILELERELEEYKKSSNKVHFYVAREKDGTLSLWLSKPYKSGLQWYGTDGTPITFLCSSRRFKFFNLYVSEYENLKWEDESIEVFLNLED